MSDPLTIIKRQIERERALEESGGKRSLGAVRKLLDFVLEHRAWGDAGVRGWIVAKSSLNDYIVGCSVLKCAVELIEAGFPDDALSIFNAIVRTLTSAEPSCPRRGLTQKHFDHLLPLKNLLRCKGIVSRYPDSWGTRLIQLQADTLYEHQETEWPSTTRIRETLAKHAGESFERPTSFSPDYDDHPDIWYYQHGGSRHDARRLIGQVIDAGLTETTHRPTDQVFSLLAGQLIDTKWGLALCQPIVALYDALRTEEKRPGWIVDAGVALVTNPAVGRPTATANWRRLLRQELTKLVNSETKRRMVEAIRNHAANEHIRANELNDVKGWGMLDDRDRGIIEKERECDRLFKPYDPRNLPQPAVTWDGPNPKDKFVCDWPHRDDHDDLRMILNLQEAPADASPEDFAEWLAPRLEAIRKIIARPEARFARWFGEVTGWCVTLISHVKKMTGARENLDPYQLPPAEYERCLDWHCAWWRSRADACIERLGGEVPASHREKGKHMAWGSNDPIHASLCYIDELLACPKGAPFDEVRQRLGQVIITKWAEWPRFTRATVLIVLRPYHWAVIEELRNLLESVPEGTGEADVLHHTLEHLLRQGAPRIPTILRQLWARIEQIDEPLKIAGLIGRVLGNAMLRFRAEGESGAVLEELAQWTDDIRTEKHEHPAARLELVHGVLWAAHEHLTGVAKLSEQHAELWLSLATWATTECFESGSTSQHRCDFLRWIMGVLSLNWPIGVRRNLYNELGDFLERVLVAGELDEYSMLHHLLSEELEGDGDDKAQPHRAIGRGDELLLRLCRASAQRVAVWRREGVTTRDLGFGGALYGSDTKRLIELVLQHARDREFVRRKLPGIVDILAVPELMALATDLRLKLRRA